MTAESSGAQAPGSGSQQAAGQSANPRTGAHAVVADAASRTGSHAVIPKHVDPARRPDVLFRVRGGEDHQMSAWWMIGAFVVVSTAAIVLLSFVPGGS